MTPATGLTLGLEFESDRRKIRPFVIWTQCYFCCILVFYFRVEEQFAGGKFREIPFAVDIIFAGGKFRAKSKFAKIAKIYSTRKICVIQYFLVTVTRTVDHRMRYVLNMADVLYKLLRHFELAKEVCRIKYRPMPNAFATFFSQKY